MEATARFPKKSFTNVQDGDATVISVVFQSPPATPPTQTVLLSPSDRSTHIVLIRPLVTLDPSLPFPLLGPTASELEPLSAHVKAFIRCTYEPLLRAAFNSSMAFIRRVLGTYPSAISFVRSNSIFWASRIPSCFAAAK